MKQNPAKKNMGETIRSIKTNHEYNIYSLRTTVGKVFSESLFESLSR